MKLQYLMSFINIIALSKSKSNIKYCELTTNDQSKYCYAKEILLAITHSPNQLAVDKSSNKLYFSFDTGQGEFVPAALDMDNKKVTVLNGVKDAFAVASDENNTIYFGGNHGIYRYREQSLNRLNIGLDIWWLFVKKNVYFIKFPSLQAYYYKKGRIEEFPTLKNKTVHQMVLDEKSNVFFINGSGFYGVKRRKYQDVTISDNPRYSGMAVDNNGDIYLCSDDGIYMLRNMVSKVKKIVNVEGVLGLAFDRLNNIVYTTGFELVRLIAMNRRSMVDNTR